MRAETVDAGVPQGPQYNDDATQVIYTNIFLEVIRSLRSKARRLHLRSQEPLMIAMATPG
ncbi:hypothetical protein C823_006355 [Eubacterium plexicaudatum ASF492]|nr:hypothetical protein C823_006355 [Eubacterium plexicaudatum ASF492]